MGCCVLAVGTECFILFLSFFGWLVVLRFTALRESSSVYQREGERDEIKQFKTTPPAPTVSTVGPYSTLSKLVGCPGTERYPAPSPEPTTHFPAGIWCQNDVVSTSMRRNHVASTLIRRHFRPKCPLGCSLDKDVCAVDT